MEPVQPNQICIYQNNTYRNNLNYLHFDNEPRVQERQQMLDQQSYTPASIAYLTYQVAARSTTPDMAIVFHARLYDKFIEIKSNHRRKKLHRKNQGSNFVGGCFSDRDIVRPPIQFRRKRQSQCYKI